MSEILTIPQAAEYLQVCDKTIRRLISNKKLSASKIGGSWRIKKSDIDDYLIETKNKCVSAMNRTIGGVLKV